MSNAVRNAIVAKLNAVPGIGKVNAYQRYADEMQELEAMYVIDTVLLGWFVSRGAIKEWQEGMKHLTATTWRITGFKAIVDVEQSELVFDDLIDTVRESFFNDITLGIDNLTTIYNNQVGLQLDDEGPVMFAGILCHCAKLSLVTVTMARRDPNNLFRPLGHQS
jgi:hypothetical protein